MVDNTRGGPPSRDRKPGGGGPGGAPGGGGPGGGQNRGGGERRDGRGGPGGGRGKGGKVGFGKGPAKPARVETYETLKELTRGEGFRIDKFVVAEKGTHRPVKTEYRLTREGLKGIHAFPRLSEAQVAATAPLPEPEPEPVEETAELSSETEVAAETSPEATDASEIQPTEEPATTESAS